MKLRSRDEIERVYNCYLKPRFGHEQVYTDGPIDRTAITNLLDDVEQRGAAQADKVLTVLSKLLGWYQARNTHYTSPIVRGMRRYHPVPRSRVLSDDELRRLWAADGMVADFCKLAILVGQRRAKLLDLRFGDIVDGAWAIRTEHREKGNGYLLKLPQLALDIIERQRQADTQPQDKVFRLYRSTLNKKVNKLLRALQIDNCRPHDLRHCSKTWMSRAGVKPWISERAIGHKIKGVEGIYDNFEWLEEKGQALDKLATSIGQIVGLNVHQLKKNSLV
jgi:integrase